MESLFSPPRTQRVANSHFWVFITLGTWRRCRAGCWSRPRITFTLYVLRRDDCHGWNCRCTADKWQQHLHHVSRCWYLSARHVCENAWHMTGERNFEPIAYVQRLECIDCPCLSKWAQFCLFWCGLKMLGSRKWMQRIIIYTIIPLKR